MEIIKLPHQTAVQRPKPTVNCHVSLNIINSRNWWPYQLFHSCLPEYQIKTSLRCSRNPEAKIPIPNDIRKLWQFDF